MCFHKSRIHLSLAALLLSLAVAGGARAQERRNLAELDEAVTELAAEVSELSTQGATSAEAVQDLANRVGVLTQELEALRRQQKAVPEAVRVIDDLELRLRAAEQEIGALRTRISAMEAPETAPPAAGGGMDYDGGYRFLTEDGHFSLRARGYVQPRLELLLDDNLDSIDVATFFLRRGRIGFDGHVVTPELYWKILVELAREDPELKDYIVGYAVTPRLELRVGQQKVRFLRTFITSSSKMTFPERPGPLENLRYARDMGAWIHGELAGGIVDYVVGFTNGAGENERNDNIDFLTAARVEVAALGEEISLGTGDYQRVRVPSLSAGAGVAHDLVQVPQRIAGVEVGNRDVDNDGVLDNVRVVSSSIDALFRYRGAELFVEGVWRHERWGTILEHSSNAELAAAVDPTTDGHDNYLAFAAHASYFVLPQTLLLGGRVSYGEVAILPLTGRTLFDQLPPGPDLLNLDVLAQLYEFDRHVEIGLMYRFANFDDGSSDDIEHLFLLESQLRF